jgi:subtilase family serine protease
MRSVMKFLNGSLLALFFLLCAFPARGAGGQALHGNIPGAVAALKPIGRMAGTNRLDLAIGLPLRNGDRLGRLLQQIYDPASPNFRHYLTPAQFTEQFGPTEADYQSVAAFAKAHGLKVSGTHPNRLLLDVSGAVGDIERALHVKMQVYQHPTEARTFYAPDSEPSLDLATPVLDVSGLDNYVVPHPCLRPIPLAKPALTGSGPSGAYLGKDFRAAYVPGVTLTGTGQTVGLLEFDSGYYQSDITAYETLAGLPNVPVSAVLLDGYGGGPGYANTEVSLDIEMAISMAPGLAGVIVYEGSTTDDILNRMATDNLARQIGASWGYPIDANSEQIFLQFAAQGQSFFNASGDSDAYTGVVMTPSDDPNITIVGGTTLTTSGPGGVWVSETVWNWGIEYGENGVGSGGGISTVYPIPSWQTNISMAANQGSTTMRNLPDVALTADNVYVIYGGGQAGAFGGTSCATPLWAAFTALVNEQAVMSGRPTVGFINPAIDTICSGGNYASCFHDITTGNNTSSASPNKFYAVSGYDLCTGWGVPAGQSLINALGTPDPLGIQPDIGFTAIGGSGGPFTVTSESFVLTNSGTNSLNWSMVNTSLWLTVSPPTGTLAGGGSDATPSVSLSAGACSLPIGNYTAVVAFSNVTSGIAQKRQFTLQIVPSVPPTILTPPASQSAAVGSNVTFNVTAGGTPPLNYQWQVNQTNINGATTRR